jgi:hypothetical protein
VEQVKKVRFLLLLIALVAIAGCGSPSTQPFDTAIDTDVTPDDGAEGDGVEDTVEVCVPTGDEVCDGEDNDCDGSVDEDFDLSSDVLNCGVCGFACEVPNGTPGCFGGLCIIEGCEDGHHDLNGSVADGCEYECTATALAESLTDGTCENGSDDDCDGRTDMDDPDCSDCVPEFCDGADNDCDSFIDEDFNLSTDPLNCGTCGHACPPRPHSRPACVLGECTVTCEPGWVNEDGDDVNGCEGTCVPDTTLDEFSCDGTDADCDGFVDEDYIPYTCGTGMCVTDSVCWAGAEDCLPITPPATSDAICDGLDEDCDGTSDEDFVPSGLCTGYCRTTARCVDATEICGDPISSLDIVCDGVDEDCDASIDEDYIPYTCGVGGCTRMSTCIAGIEDCIEGGPAPEICNGSDDDCDDVIDNGSPTTLCTPPPHATPACVGGTCVISSCDGGYYDADLVFGNGCECTPESTESSSTACGTPYDLGTFSDSGTTTTFSGNVVPSGDTDWYRFTATDTPDSSCDHFDVVAAFTTNPGNVFRMDVYRGSCTSSAICSNVSDQLEWYTNFRSGSGTTAVGECPCNNGAILNNNLCNDNSATFYIKVYRAAGAPMTCDNYTIRVSNGL